MRTKNRDLIIRAMSEDGIPEEIAGELCDSARITCINTGLTAGAWIVLEDLRIISVQCDVKGWYKY